MCGAACGWEEIEIRLESHGGRRGLGNFGADMLHKFGRVVFNARHQYLQLIR